MPLTVTELWRYPLKSGRGERLETAAVERLGLAGDRRWMVVDGSGHCATAREHPRLLLVEAVHEAEGLRLTAPGHGTVFAAPWEARAAVHVHSNGPLDAALAACEADRWLSEWLGAEVRLARADGRTHRALDSAFTRPDDSTAFADAYPILAATEASLARVNEWIGAGPLASEGPLDMRRFRPNVVVAGGDPFDEDGWRRVRIGSAVFRSPKGCDRCVMTTTDPDTAGRGREPIATLARHRRWDGKTWFGMNLVPDVPGVEIRVGDEVEILEAVEAPDGPPRPALPTTSP